jgi:hypothetical protein
MSGQTELITAKYLTETTEVAERAEPTDTTNYEISPPRAKLTFLRQVMRGVQNFVIVMIFVGLLATVGKWALFSASESTSCADWFLWAAGSEKTWDEYQRDHVRQGHKRMEDKDASWLEQLFIDGYAGLND